MPRYLFHFACKDEFIPDYEGVVLDDLQTAHRHAMRLVWQTMPLLQAEDLRHWHVEVADESQLVLLIVLFPAVPARPQMPFGQRERTKNDRVDVRRKAPGGNANLFLPPGGEGYHPWPQGTRARGRSQGPEGRGPSFPANSPSWWTRSSLPSRGAKQKNPRDLLAEATVENVRLKWGRLASADPIVSTLVKDGKVKVAGGVYDIRSGRVNLV
jgi:hypothetical protein